jgi:hypothetical protein
MGKITKKSIAFLIAQCLYCRNILLLLSKILLLSLYLNFMENSFHFMSQKYQDFQCRVIRTGPKSPTLPYIFEICKKSYTRKCTMAFCGLLASKWDFFYTIFFPLFVELFSDFKNMHFCYLSFSMLALITKLLQVSTSWQNMYLFL